MVLADGVGPGAEDAVDRVLFVLLLLMLHGPVLPAGQTAVLGCHAVAVLGLMSIGRQEIPSAVLAQAGRVDVMHPVQQVKTVKLHRRGKVDPLHEYHLFFVPGALGKHIGGCNLREDGECLDIRHGQLLHMCPEVLTGETVMGGDRKMRLRPLF